jgi:hypothetical protein
MLAEVACGSCIFLVKEVADSLFATGDSTMEDMASAAINVLDIWSWPEKSINR